MAFLTSISIDNLAVTPNVSYCPKLETVSFGGDLLVEGMELDSPVLEEITLRGTTLFLSQTIGDYSDRLHYASFHDGELKLTNKPHPHPEATSTATVTFFGSVFSRCSVVSFFSAGTVFLNNSSTFSDSLLESFHSRHVVFDGKSFFSPCPNLTSFTATSVDVVNAGSAFADCTRLTNLNFTIFNFDNNAIPPHFVSECTSLSIDGVIFSEITNIGSNAFSHSRAKNVSFPVTTIIENSAFAECESLLEISIPLVKEIGAHCFSNCTLLQSIYLPVVTDIYLSAFSHCYSLLLEEGSLAMVKYVDNDAFRHVPIGLVSLETIEFVGGQAFYGCTELMLAANSLTNAHTIHMEAFKDCLNIEEVHLDSVIWLGNSVFSGCPLLTIHGNLSKCAEVGDCCFDGDEFHDIVNFSSMATIGKSAFEHCHTIGLGQCTAYFGSLTTLGARAFFHSDLFTSIETFNVNKIPEFCFAYCDELDHFPFEHIVGIADGAFKDCAQLVSVTAPALITLADSAFYECVRLENVTMPSLTTIAASAFALCLSLTNIGISHVSIIGESAFFNCRLLTELDLPLLVSLGKSAFHGCSNLNSVSLPNLQEIPEDAFNGCALREFNGGTSLIQVNAFANNTNLTHVVTDVEFLQANAFVGCISLVNFTGARVKQIEPSTFDGCCSLADVQVGEIYIIVEQFLCLRQNLRYLEGKFSVVSDSAFDSFPCLEEFHTHAEIDVGPRAFRLCSSLHTFKGTLISVGKNGFSSCEMLCNIDLSLGRMTGIGDYGFFCCLSLEAIEINLIDIIGEAAFSQCTSLAFVYIWDIAKFEQAAFSECTALTAFYIEDITHNAIPANTFDECHNLTTVRIGNIDPVNGVVYIDRIETIGLLAFHHCHLITKLISPSVSIVHNHAFVHCYGLCEISLPTLFSLGLSSFSNCSSLTKIEIAVCNIFADAFDMCYNLEEINIITDGVDMSKQYKIGALAFCGLTKLESIDLSAYSEIGDSAFEGCSSLHSLSSPLVFNTGTASFANCISLTTVKFTALTAISARLFANCVALHTISLGNCTAIHDEGLMNCRSLPNISNDVQYLGVRALKGCHLIHNLIFESPLLLVLHDEVFADMLSLESVSAFVTVIKGDRIFANDAKLASIALPNLAAVNHTFTGIFANCTSLTSLTLPSTPPEKFAVNLFAKPGQIRLNVPTKRDFKRYRKDPAFNGMLMDDGDIEWWVWLIVALGGVIILAIFLLLFCRFKDLRNRAIIDKYHAREALQLSVLADFG